MFSKECVKPIFCLYPAIYICVYSQVIDFTVHYFHICHSFWRKVIPFLLTRTWRHFVSDDTTTIWYLFWYRTAQSHNVNWYVCLLEVCFRSNSGQLRIYAASSLNLLWRDMKGVTHPAPETMIITYLIWDLLDLVLLSSLYYTYKMLLLLLI
jgi:hypothetical protein